MYTSEGETRPNFSKSLEIQQAMKTALPTHYNSVGRKCIQSNRIPGARPIHFQGEIVASCSSDRCSATFTFVDGAWVQS